MEPSQVRTRLPLEGGSRLWSPKFPASRENTGNFQYSLANGTTTALSGAVVTLPYVDGRSTCHFRPPREARASRGLIEKLERKLEQHRADLTHIDGVLRLFQPDRDPGDIKPKRTYVRRTRYFARNELSRLCMDALRAAADGVPITTDSIADQIIETKGFNAADTILHGSIRDQVLTLLRSFSKRAAVEQIGLGRGVRWRLARREPGLL
jgi:hypothetical protein